MKKLINDPRNARREFLAGLGCHAFQGYLFSRPLPVNEFEALQRVSAR